MNEPLAHRFFDAREAANALTEEVEDRILSIAGIDPYGGNWPWQDFTYDGYDRSFELKDAVPGWRPTQEVVDAWLALGFSRFWICYTDKTEWYWSIDYPAGCETANSIEARTA